MNPAAALVLAAAVAATGAAVGWLTAGGALGAAAIGAMVLWGGGLAGGVLLGLFFLSGSVLTYVQRPVAGRPRRSTGGRVWQQVAANGGWAAVGAATVALDSQVGWAMLVGSLAAAQADTWSTEIGRLSPRPPRLITSGRRVPPGTSGGVTWLGSAAGVTGAGVLSAVAVLLRVPASTAAAGFLGGVAGTLLDSVLGATVQGRYHCATCERNLERSRHDCTGQAVLRGGFGWIDNDVVNLLATAAGAGMAVGMAVVLRG